MDTLLEILTFSQMTALLNLVEEKISDSTRNAEGIIEYSGVDLNELDIASHEVLDDADPNGSPFKVVM